MSVRPVYAAKIFQGQKTVELRRKFPQNGVVGGLALFYSSSPVRAVVGFAQIKQVLKLPVSRIWHEYGVAACISRDDFNNNYFTNLPCGFVIRFSGFKSLDQEVKARELEDKFGIVPPQSYRYLSEECAASLSNE